MADNLPGLDDLLKSIIEDDKPQSSSALAVVPKKPDDLVEEDIDSQILSILGLEDVFDLTYEEYASLLKEASVKGRMPNSQMTTESIELVTEEFKRVKNKTGKFKVKPKKVDINKVLNRRQPTPSSAIVKPQKLIPQGIDSEEEPQKKVDSENLQDDLLNGIGNILESLITIKTVLQSQSKTEQKSAQEDRKKSEKEKKKDREKSLEKKKTSFKLPGMLSKPVDNFFESIKRFFTNVLLGSVVLGIFKWLKNPANQKAIDGFANFLQNNAGLILGGLLAIAALPLVAPLLSLTGAITGIAIPAIAAAFSFLASPAGLAALAVIAGTTVVAKGGEVVMQKVQKAVGSTGVTKNGTAFNLGDINALKQEQEKFITQNKYSDEVRDKLIKPYDNLLDELRKKRQIEKDIENINRNISAMPQQEWRWKPELEKKQQELNESTAKTTELFGKLGITDANLKQSQMRRGGRKKDDSYVDPNKTRPNALQNLLSNTQRLLGISGSQSSYNSPFAGARDKEALKASKITGNAPITIGEKASAYSASRGRPHRGRDIAAPSGTGLQVPSDSVITDKGTETNYGNYVVFKDANGFEHFYGHMLETTSYNVGDRVSAGTVIGRVGSTGRSTGPHLHWEVSRVMGEVGRPRQNVIDPIEIGFPAQAPFTGKVEAAQISQTKPSTPSIPSPTGRSNIVPLPIPLGVGQQQPPQSNSAPLQSPVPRFSSEDPNNMTTMVVKSIYNVVG